MQIKRSFKFLKSCTCLILEFLPIFVLFVFYIILVMIYIRSNGIRGGISEIAFLPLFLLLSQLIGYSSYLNFALLIAMIISLIVASNLRKKQQVNLKKGSKQEIIKIISAFVCFYIVCSWFLAKIWVDQCNNELNMQMKTFPRVCFFYEEPKFVGSESICYAKIILNKEETKKFMDDNREARLASPGFASFNDTPLGKLLGWNPKSGKDIISGQMTFEGRGFIQYYIDQSRKKKDVLYLMYWIY